VTYPFADWLPDAPGFQNSATIALNVRPDFTSYSPFPDLGNAASTALTARARGAISVSASDGTSYTFAGDATKLYKLAGGTFSDVSVGGGYSLSVDENWEAVLFNGTVVFASINANLQGYTLGTSALFATLPVSTLKPKARHIAVVRSQFLMLGNVDESGTIYTNRLRWSALGDATSFDQSASTQSDYQDLLEGFGWIQRIIGGEYALIFSDHGIHRADYIGPPDVFQILPVPGARGRGCIAPGSVIEFNGIVYALDSNGFYACDGQQAVSISDGKVKQWFQDNENADQRHRITATVDPERSLIMWSFCSSSASDPDTILIYHVNAKKFTTASISCELIFGGQSGGYDMDTNAPGEVDDLETTTGVNALSLDSRFWMGGVHQLAAFDTSHVLKYFDGSNLAATIETGRLQLYKDERALVSAFRPQVEGTATITGAVSGTERLNDADSFGTAIAQEVDGSIPVDPTSARYHKFRTSIAAATDWDHAIGVEVEAQADGDF